MHHLECFKSDDATLDSGTPPIDTLTFYFQYFLVPDRDLDTDASILSADDLEPVFVDRVDVSLNFGLPATRHLDY